ncbi:MAG: trigger factor [Nitrospinales bacterium]
MKIEIEDIDSCTKKLTLQIPHQVYRQKVDAYLMRVGNQAKIPGFRKGKVPKSIIEKMVGPDARKEVLSQLISESLHAAIEEKGINAAGLPADIDVQAEEGTDIRVSAMVEVFPEIAIKDYAGIEMEMKIARVTDEDVEKVIEHYRNRAAKSVPVTDRPVRDRDFVKIDFKGTMDGKPFAGGEGKEHILQVGAKRFIEGFEEQLVGMNIGETRDIRIKAPDDYPGREIAGKTLDFQVTLKGIQEKQLPELDDEFARTADPERKFADLAAMRTKIRDLLEEEEHKAAKKLVKKRLAETLTEMNPIDVPETLVQEQIRFMAERAKSRSGAESESGRTPGKALPVSAEDESAHREAAIKILQQEIIIGKLTEDLGIEVGENELNREIKSFLKVIGANTPKKTQRDWQKNGTVARLRTRMIREKTLDRLMEKIKIKEEMVDREKVIADN